MQQRKLFLLIDSINFKRDLISPVFVKAIVNPNWCRTSVIKILKWFAFFIKRDIYKVTISSFVKWNLHWSRLLHSHRARFIKNTSNSISCKCNLNITFSKYLYRGTDVISKYNFTFITFQWSSCNINSLACSLEITLTTILFACPKTELFGGFVEWSNILWNLFMAYIHYLMWLNCIVIVFVSE